MKKVFLNSWVFMREWLDPAFERSPYQGAMQQPKKQRAGFTFRLIPKRRMAIR